ncbi:hypothetical protein [Desulfocastanea catecholica]
MIKIWFNLHYLFSGLEALPEQSVLTQGKRRIIYIEFEQMVFELDGTAKCLVEIRMKRLFKKNDIMFLYDPGCKYQCFRTMGRVTEGYVVHTQKLIMIHVD